MQFQEKVWKVPDIECEGCVRSIHRALDDADGVQQVEVDLLQKTVRVVFDGERVRAEHLKQLIKEAGFTPSE
ncbi:MAG: copper-binding protein [Armatimonadetes bacterium JP3_11]|jgi:copper chaperone|nr:MAG: copper-binding protein [Armatimonadetes bacterium CP1_7O]OYT75699.1 MAG: copper-binding protein [Armatimonadetes bacterium JP3_11]RMH08855.1 MAG: copper chaperone [Armatimonadota bacterium]